MSWSMRMSNGQQYGLKEAFLGFSKTCVMKLFSENSF